MRNELSRISRRHANPFSEGPPLGSGNLVFRKCVVPLSLRISRCQSPMHKLGYIDAILRHVNQAS